MPDVRTRLLALLVIPVVTSCGASHVAASITPKATPSGTLSSATDIPTSTASPTSTPSTLCRLPLVPQTGTAGFISYPGGAFGADPSAAVKTKANGLAYDRVFTRWLPVPWALVSSDGRHYAYGDYPDFSTYPPPDSVLHVVDVATGRDRVVARGQYVVSDYETEGVYLTQLVGGHDGPGPQIGSLLNLGTGSIRQLSGGAQYGYLIGGGRGWRAQFNTADPTTHEGMGFWTNELVAVRLTDGSSTTWFYRRGVDSVDVIGFDRQLNPVIAVATGNTSVILDLTAPNVATQLYSGPIGAFVAALGDGVGIWLSGQTSGTYLWPPGGPLKRISTTGGVPAGGCH
ncbi:MAG: hypothetical protein E6I84_15300 [Chloroflexi bacterium]|nr:MAG: hypothetical protein E6I84_15300 [Chloroflexota bacterium]